MMHDFKLHEFFHSPKNVLLKALLYTFSLLFSSLFIFQSCKFNSSYILKKKYKSNNNLIDWILSMQLSFLCT